jgi:hypothetical protein
MEKCSSLFRITDAKNVVAAVANVKKVFTVVSYDFS